MIYWPFFDVPVQAHSVSGVDYANLYLGSEGDRVVSSLQGIAYLPWVENQGDWIDFSGPYAIKSDGTLWTFGGGVQDALFEGYFFGGRSRISRPYQVGSDKDWKSFSGRFILKNDGSLWSLGSRERGSDTEYTFWGRRRSDYSSGTYGNDSGFRAVISSPIRSVVLYGYQPYFARKPTVTVESRKIISWNQETPAALVGSGAMFSVDWKGQIRDIRLVSGGSGYTSAPVVSAVPQGGDFDDGLKVWAVMVPSATAGFSVESGGSGYTSATATDPVTGATATAVVESGSIKSWTMNSPGTASRIIHTSPYSVDSQATMASIQGDGTGATARCVAAPTSIAEIRAGNSSSSSETTSADKDNPQCWSKPPLISIAGGGGSGASAVVDNLWGVINSIGVLNGGSGYSGGSLYRLRAVATPGEGDSLSTTEDVGDITLSGGSVVRIEGPPSPVFLGGQKESSGVVKKFSIVIYDESATLPLFVRPVSAELVGASGMTVPLTLSTEESEGRARVIASLDSDTGGFGLVKPYLRTFARGVPGNFNWNFGLVPVPFGAAETTRCIANAGNCIPCNPSPSILCFNEVETARQSFTAAVSPTPLNVPSAVKKVKARGENGSEHELKNVNGVFFQSSRKNKLSNEKTEFSPYGIRCDYPLAGDGLALVSAATTEVEVSDSLVRFSEAPLSDSLFVPARTAEFASVYCVDGRNCSAGVDSLASGTASLSQGAGGFWGYSSVSLIRGGVGYTEEPNIIFFVQSRPLPERVGDKTWDSISIAGVLYSWLDPNVFLGVTKSGDAFFIFPNGDETPVGRGVKISVSSTKTDFIDIGRLVIDPPDSLFGRKPAFARDFFNGSPVVVSALKSMTATADGEDQRTYEGFALLQTNFGFGYTTAPSVRFLELDPDNPIFTVSATLVGPDRFSRASGGLLIDNQGVAWDPFSDEDSIAPTLKAIKSRTGTTTLSRKQDAEYCGFDDFSSQYENEFQECKAYRVAIFKTGFGNSGPISGTSLIPGGRVSGGLVPTGSTSSVGGEFHCGESATGGNWNWASPTGQETVNFCKAWAIAYNHGYTKVDSTGTWIAPTTSQSSFPFSLSYLADGRVSTGAGSVFYRSSLGIPGFPAYCTSPPSVNVSGDASIEVCEVPESSMRKVPRVVENRGSIVWLGDNTVGYYLGGFVFVDPALSGLESPKNTSSRIGKIEKRLLGLPRFYIDYFFVATNWDQCSPRLRHIFDLEIKLDSFGSGYTEPPVIALSQPPRTAVVETKIDGRARGAAIIRPGAGFHSPPTLTVTANDKEGNGASLTAVIQGPVYDTKVTSGGSEYRCPPEVLFSTNGVPCIASASCSGSITSVAVADGGSGFRSPPEIKFYGEGSGASATAKIKGRVQYVTVTNGGSGYTSEPTISFTGGGGSGASAIPVLAADGNGKFRVTRVITTSGGTNYTSEPSVTFSGGSGSGAAAKATLDASIESVDLVSGGSGYRNGTVAVAGDAKLGVSLSMSVDAIDIEYGGRYRQQPTISFQSFNHAESITLKNKGSGYSSPPLVAIASPCGRGAKAECKISASVSSILVSNGGEGYINPPLVEMVGGCDPVTGKQAKAKATVSNGSVVSVDVSDAGSGYFRPPTVSFVENVEAILKCSVADGKIAGVDVVSGGYGYAAPPFLSFKGGEGAKATATVADGRIASVSVTDGGSGYTDAAKCLIASGIGSKAEAFASISGEVSSVTLTDCGYGFEPGEPVSVVFSGGGGKDAQAEVTTASKGSGASATARINGSIVAVKIDSQGTKYQTSPTVSVDMSNNFLAKSPSDPNFLPYIQLRIAGRVSEAKISTPGSGYGSRDDRFNIFTKPPWATVPPGPLGGPITAVSHSQAGLTGFYSSPPRMDFENTVVPYCEVSCLSGAFSVDVGESGAGPSRSGEVYKAEATPPADIFRPSSAQGQSFSMLGKLHVINNYIDNSIPRRVYFRIEIGKTVNTLVSFPVFSGSSLPTFTVVDASGSGAVAQMASPSSLSVTNPGIDYTLDATFYARGGVPASWESPPVGSVSIDQSTGKIVGGITWTKLGNGGVHEGGAFADVYLDGGGEAEGSALPAGTLTYSQASQPIVFNPAPTFEERTFSSTPKVVVVVREKPIHRQRPDVSYQSTGRPPTVNQLLATDVSLPITDALPESIASSPTSSANISALGSPQGFGDGWLRYPHYWDGQVSFVWISYPEQARAEKFPSPPTFSFSLGGEGSGASAHAENVGWAEYFSDDRAVRAP